jgi:hypothetical protein
MHFRMFINFYFGICTGYEKFEKERKTEDHQEI